MDALVQVKERRLLSQDLEKNIEFSNSQIQEVGYKVRKYKKQLNGVEDKMDEYVKSETELERKAVEEALKNLQNKLHQVKSSTTYKNLDKEAEYIEKKLNITMEKVYPHYEKAVKRIYKAYLDEKERSRKLLEFHEVIGDAFLSKDEKKVLNLIQSQMKMIPHNVINIPMIGFTS